MTEAMEWECWTLCKEDIDFVASRMGMDSSTLTPTVYSDIARRFREGLQWANEDWELIIEDCLDDLMKNMGQAGPEFGKDQRDGSVPLKGLRGDCHQKETNERGG